MYNLNSAKKAVNGLNNIIKESNDKIIDDFVNKIFDDLDLSDEQIEKINQISYNMKDDISKANLLNLLQKKKKKEGPKKPPSEYNLYIQKKMPGLKEEFPNEKQSVLLGKAAKLWNEEKNKKNDI